MPRSSKSIFNQRAAEKLRSPDDLDKYVRVANPSMWVVLVACAALLVGLLAWGVFGAVTTSVGAAGVSVEGKVMCFLPANESMKVQVGDEANVNGEHMTVSDIAALPVSRDEADEILQNDYLLNALVTGDWTYQISFEGDAAFQDGIPLNVSITTERIAPITLVLGGNA